MSIVILKRRAMLIGAAAALLAPSLPTFASSHLIVTPGQTEGPFYPVSLPADMDNDLVRVQGQQAQAMGQVTHIAGRVLNRRGEPCAAPGGNLAVRRATASTITRASPGCSGATRRSRATAAWRRRGRPLRLPHHPPRRLSRAARRTSISRCTRRARAG